MAATLFPLAAPQGPEQPHYGPDLAVRLICPDCRNPCPNIAEEFASGDLVCGDCGLVLGDRIVDTRSEWRTFANDEGDDPSRVGAASDPLLDGMGQFETVIGFKDGGSGLASDLQRAALRAQDSSGSSRLISAFHDIVAMCDHLSLTKTVSDRAKVLYKQCEEEKIFRGKPLDATVAACIFVACRHAGVPRTFQEMCLHAGVSKKALGGCFKVIRKKFDLQANADGPQSGPEDLLVRYCNHLAMPPYTEGYCKHVIVTARELGIAEGRSPVTIVGAAILFICQLLGIQKDLQDIARVAGASGETIRIVYNLYFAEKEKLVKKEWLDNGRAKMERLRIA
ncbi:unnamed protein product [Peniophora sp. CBMAI 1063]|nr:unnamed protein product [Peniophora sp. CBMAI 1063]